MQRPAEMVWSTPKCAGSAKPSKRSGHTMSIVGDFIYVFGGNDFRRPPGPNAELFKLDMSNSNEFYWEKIEPPSGAKWPEARSHHTAVVYEEKLIIFGGFRSSSIRYNDVWIFDTNTKEWSQPHAGLTETKEDGTVVFKKDWKDCPLPRGGHSACMIGDSKMYIFGGYGGSGYARLDYNDVNVLDLSIWEWFKVPATGELPPERSGHQGCAVLEKMYVMGGWNSMLQFNDMYILDTTTNEWTKPEENTMGAAFGAPRWNFAAVSVFAVPYWKIFIFGGNSGDLNDGGNPRGDFLNDMAVLETGSNAWSRPTTLGNCPTARGETQIVYDPKGSKIILFGGWANRWFDEVYICKVADVVGPPYSIDTVAPAFGPITGGGKSVIKGMGFKSVGGNQCSVRFACPKGFAETSGTVIDDDTIEFDTPGFEKYGTNLSVEGRVNIGGKGLTNSVVTYTYFAVTSCETSIMFGPASIDGVFSAPYPTMQILQMRDFSCQNRTCGFDEFTIVISEVTEDGKDGKEKLVEVDAALNIIDQEDGTYKVEMTYPKAGTYSVSVKFDGTFKGKAGHIRGSPYRVEVKDGNNDEADPSANDINGPLVMTNIRKQIKDTKSWTEKCLKTLKTHPPKDDLEALIKVKDTLAETEHKTIEIELGSDMSQAALEYFSLKGQDCKKMLEQVSNVKGIWNDVLKQHPMTTNAIVPTTKTWSGIVEQQIEEYAADLAEKAEAFKELPFWGDKVDIVEARKNMKQARKTLDQYQTTLAEKKSLCTTFEFPKLVKEPTAQIAEMELFLSKMQDVWTCMEAVDGYIADSKTFLWAEMNIGDLEDGAKGLFQKIKQLHKCTFWCDAYKLAKKKVVNFQNTVPLIAALHSPALRDRHWTQVKEIVKKEFNSPLLDKNLVLGELINLQLHEFAGDIEDTCEAATKELKIEITVVTIAERWKGINWLMDPYKESDVPLLKIAEEDFEALEADALSVQSMLASRFVKIFQADVEEWQHKLGMINDVFVLITEIQRTWSYLEPLFIGSEEVKKELPEDAKRFKGIDENVRKELKKCWEIKNIEASCNQDDLQNRLDSNQGQLNICKKSLADFLDGRRRQFPRYYFTSESDLLDILSNGSTPENILKHTSKIYLSTKMLTLDKERTASDRPYAVEFVAGVGSENVDFEPRVPLDGKVEIYHQTILDAMKLSLFKILTRSIVRYAQIDRGDWLMHKIPDDKSRHPGVDSSDPAQIMLLVVAIYYVQEVENVFKDFAKGGQNAMKEYQQKQVGQLKQLITLTQSGLNKSDRTRVMVTITMDAHSRDIVTNMIRDHVVEDTHFMWQSQLKHKFRKSPSNAPHQNRDTHLRGDNGERAEIAICDAICPYDYEYLGNGARLVITPLTDRIYVTATQALNLKMGCAPAGPAGTGKTESTKDLASALAKCCYVFNCSPEMDYLGLGNIFKGLASSGSWGCFDEFNRLIPEVLSVCTVQFKAVCDGVKADAARIVVENDQVSLDPTCGAFITMNPGYLGRSELPEGLKALFRPITVMVPDLVLICENMLMAEGFTEGKILASKFYGLYSLLRDLLSKQMHYDWGLRAVKSVLVVAGGFKRAEPDLQEEALLMRALRDFNTPKIVQEDTVIFFGLLGDLFPGIDPPRKEDPELENNVEQACIQTGLDPDIDFRLKVVQLEELLGVRHCVFVMGPPGAGKSSAWKTLAKARELAGAKTKIVDINPKSLKTEELYGFISMATREWRDGLLSKVMRDLGEIPDEKPKWIILDGDLDANWIESMNSVMDDNKMLTLASNERIPLKAHMRMLFEIRDLNYATPATVSRAGILFISTDKGTQWRSLITSWLISFGLERKSDEDMEMKKEERPAKIAILRKCFDDYVPETLRWIAKNVKPVVTLQDMNFVQTLLYMCDGTITQEVIDSEHSDSLEKAFAFCTIWAMGSALGETEEGNNRKLYSDFWRGAFGRKVKMPTQYTVFDYWYDPTENTFEMWSKSPFLSAEMMEFDPLVTPMQSVTVPTPETCSVTFWMNMLVKMRRPVMLAGPSGTGKTQIVQGLLNEMDPADYLHCAINFNFYTTSAVLQSTMGLPLVKKTGTNFGPPGNAKMVYFVDDINLPEVDKYNTQSAIALLRQHLEYEHVYDLTKLTNKNISNTQLIACMNPSAGSFEINPRLQRWFATFAIALPEVLSLMTIYQTFLTGHLKRFDESILHQTQAVVKAAVQLHIDVVKNFKKTAQNFHYEFNIRHISNVFQGLLVSEPDQFPGPEKFVHLWVHESERVYGDRLVSLEDLNRYNTLALNVVKKVFPNYGSGMARFYATEGADPLVFCHFADNIQEKLYDLVPSVSKMSEVLEGALSEYNEVNAAMDLVLFEDAMKHVARCVRVVMNTGGHALLVGVGGSGKQSLSRLSSFICGYTVTQIVISSTYSINDLKDDLKNMYMKAGVKQEGVMFLLTDSQITNERFLVYINDLLASGNIPDLFAQDEVDTIVNSVVKYVKELGQVPDKNNCWDYFIGQIRKNLHVVLAFSPVGDDFRTRARKFPAIVNCTVIDWFQPWPYEALFSVGKKFMAEVELGAVRDTVERFLPYSFTEVNKMAATFFRQERRQVYTTPKSFLELLKLFGGLLGTKRHQADAAIERLDNGLQKLRKTAKDVTKIEADLKISLEEADQKRTVAEGIAEVVSKEKAIVEVETAKAQVQEAEVAEIQAEVSAQQDFCSTKLAAAEPAVERAMAALDTLDKKDLSEAKGMLKPPSGVDDIFAATMYLLATLVPSIQVSKTGKPKDVSWDATKKQLLGNIGEYIDALKGLKDAIDTQKVPDQNFKNCNPLLALEHFNFETISTKNKAAAGLCSFVVNICAYYDVVTTVEPLRLALAAANAQLDAANSQLKEVQDKVADLQAKLEKLTIELNQAEHDKQEALDAVDKGQKKLDLAMRLTNALASENVRWAENIITMQAEKELLTGDVLLASAFISYVGPFTKKFRDQLMNKVFTPFLMENFAKNLGIDLKKLNEPKDPDEEEDPDAPKAPIMPLSAAADPVKILTSAAVIAGWQSDSLPSDQVSTENGTIVTSSARWPLIIDPQLQGIKWIRQKESTPERNLAVVRLGQNDLLRKLEFALDNGYSMLIENIGESIDAVLNPVIQRAFIRRGKKAYIKLGDHEVEFNPNFRLFIHTKLSNPHYPPEIQAECTLVNFTVTFDGLEDQLLALTVRKERLDLATLSEDLVKQQNQFTIKMIELEDNILDKLSKAEGDITEDVDLIEGLETTKQIANDIAQKQIIAAQTQSEIKETSEKYRGVANRSSLLFFLMNDLVKMHTYYIYSLEAFTTVFYMGIDRTPKNVLSPRATEGEELDEAALAAQAAAEDARLKERCVTLIDSITRTVFNYVRRGLFETDKLTVATILTLRIAVNDGLLPQEEVDLLVSGNVSTNADNMGPLEDWLPPAIWPQVRGLEDLKKFNNLGNDMQNDCDDWREWFDTETPETSKIPSDYEKTLNDFDRLILLRVIRPDRVTTALKKYIGKVMGSEYVTQPPFDMEACYNETTNQIPTFFVLFAGVDPTLWVEDLGKKKGMTFENGTFKNISMGQGQEAPAEAVVSNFAKNGGWVMLQNCHLMQSWVPRLEDLLEKVQTTAHPDFRCFVSAEPPPLASWKNMPESLMQGSVKVANEAPADIKSNILRGWDNFNHERVESCSKKTDFKACLYALCWFHSIVLGRRRFGQQGWSRKYSFNTGDLTICANVLQSYLEANVVVPWQDLRYIFGEIMYGGHITDAWDRRTCNNYLMVIVNEGLHQGMEFGPGFKSPDATTLDYDGYLQYTQTTLPGDSPSLFGLHPNAEIGYLTNWTTSIFSTIQILGGGGAGDDAGGGNVIKDKMKYLLDNLPEFFQMIDILEMAEPLLEGETSPYVMVAIQETQRMNNLMKEIQRSLTELEKGMKGVLNMSQSMEDLIAALTINQWPGRNPFSTCMWEKKAWPSMKNLLNEYADMVERIKQLQTWTLELKTPRSLWLPGLFNPTSYLTAVMQVTSRRTKMPLDQMTTETFVTTYTDPKYVEDYWQEAPPDGAFVHGLYIEGARWPTLEEMDGEQEEVTGVPCSGVLFDSRLKELLPPLPVIYVKAVQVQPTWEPSAVGYLRRLDYIYEAPVYLTSFRGHTYVFLATLKTNAPNSKWVLTGTAILMQTD
jgi:dynein heavy chain